jgi:hypothetical protein
MLNRLELVRRERLGGGGQTQRSWLDFIVDGASLCDTLKAGGYIGCLGWGDPGVEASSLRQLMQGERSQLPDGRVMIYVCAECGDLGCGAVTVAVRREGDTIIWDHFGLENNYDPEMTDRESYRHVGPLRFPAEHYWHTLVARQREISA